MVRVWTFGVGQWRRPRTGTRGACRPAPSLQPAENREPARNCHTTRRWGIHSQLVTTAAVRNGPTEGSGVLWGSPE
eukprot:15431597-Alexandrium_andersonii.AAC.1